MTERPFSEKRKLEWQIEHRILFRQKCKIDARLAELEEMLAAFFPETAR